MSGPLRVRKRPVEVEAWWWSPSADPEMIAAWCGGEVRDGVILMLTLEGPTWADPGDWIIKGFAGEFYPCKPHIFTATYEVVG